MSVSRVRGGGVGSVCSGWEWESAVDAVRTLSLSPPVSCLACRQGMMVKHVVVVATSLPFFSSFVETGEGAAHRPGARRRRCAQERG